MKKIAIALVSIFLLSSVAHAGSLREKAPFSSYSAASTAAVYSEVYNVKGAKSKELQVNGYDMTTKASASLAGTILAQCGPTSTGPWITAQNEAGTAISTTANKAIQWSDLCNFMRISWAKTTGRVSVWFNYME